jgi:acetyl/propionyl-CoA carboxylase alpha subunit
MQISVLSRALDEYRLVGIRSTIGLFRKIFKEPDFLAGKYDTTYLEKRLVELTGSNEGEESDRPIVALALAEYLASNSAAATGEAAALSSPWKLLARREALRGNR